VGAVIPVLVRIPLTVGFLAIAGVAAFALVTYVAGQRGISTDVTPTAEDRTTVADPTTVDHTAIQSLPDDTRIQD